MREDKKPTYWFAVQKEADPRDPTFPNLPKPMVTPARTLASALNGLSFAHKKSEVLRIEIREDRVVEQGNFKTLTSSPLITFTRTGPQEFADGGDRAWWERR